MELTLTIPDDLATSLRQSLGEDLERAALERLTLDGYRAGHLSRYQVQRLLGFDNRYDAEEAMAGTSPEVGGSKSSVPLERAADLGLIADLASVDAEIRTMRFHISGALLDESLGRHHRTQTPE